MDYDTFTGQTVSEAVGLVNLFADATTSVDEDDLRQLLALYDLDDDPLDVDGFGALAVRLGEVFTSPDVSRRVRLLNALLEAHAPRPFLAEHDGQSAHFHYVPDDGAALRRVGASLAMAVAHVVVDDGAERLGACRADDCARVFVDRTRNRSQQFCSKTCASRIHVAAHRARR